MAELFWQDEFENKRDFKLQFHKTLLETPTHTLERYLLDYFNSTHWSRFDYEGETKYFYSVKEYWGSYQYESGAHSIPGDCVSDIFVKYMDSREIQDVLRSAYNDGFGYN